MVNPLRSIIAVSGIFVAAHAAAQITFYEGEGFRGPAFSTSSTINDFGQSGFNDRASSAVVDRGLWEVCEHIYFGGRCAVLRRGSYESFAAIGLNNRISSVRPIVRPARYYENEVTPPLAEPTYEYRQRPNERIYQADVTSVRAVVGPPEHQCWVERQQVVENRSEPNVPGAIIGAVIGGVLGHQVGGGRGRDVATAGGAVAGAAIGANAGHGSDEVYSQDVRRCTTVPNSARPDYWDVTYIFRGQEHRVQMTAPPGPTIAVNAFGEPRG